MSVDIWLQLPTGLARCEVDDADAEIIRDLDNLISDLNIKGLYDQAKKIHIVKMKVCDAIVSRGNYD